MLSDILGRTIIKKEEKGEISLCRGSSDCIRTGFVCSKRKSAELCCNEMAFHVEGWI